MTRLRPGELKILQALSRGEKSYTQLNNETGLQFNILSRYLKDLWKSGLITRDIDTRIYRIVPIGWQTLFLKDLEIFISDHIAKIGSKDLRDAGVDLWSQYVIMSDSSQFLESLENSLLDNHEINTGLAAAFATIGETWERNCLLSFDEKRQKMISEYKQDLLAALKIRDMHRTVCSKEKYSDLFETIGEPRILEELSEAQDTMYQPRDLAGLEWHLDFLRREGFLRDDLTEDENETLKEIEGRLHDPKRLSTYEEYLEKVAKQPKALIILPSYGFIGYRRKVEEMHL